MHENRDSELIYSVKSYCVCAPQIYVIKCFLIFIIYKVKNFAANNNQSSYWSQLCTEIRTKKLVTDWRFVQQMKEGYYNNNQVLSKGSTVGWYIGIGQGSGKIPHTCNCLIIDQWILRSSDLEFTWQGFCLERDFPHLSTNPRVNLIFAAFSLFNDLLVPLRFACNLT